MTLMISSISSLFHCISTRIFHHYSLGILFIVLLHVYFIACCINFLAPYNQFENFPLLVVFKSRVEEGKSLLNEDIQENGQSNRSATGIFYLRYKRFFRWIKLMNTQIKLQNVSRASKTA